MREGSRVREYLRTATEADVDLLFEWANEASVRSNSFQTAEIAYEEHKQWYANLLQNKECRQYIYMYDDKPVGQIRLTVCGHTAEIGYSVSVENRCMGHGRSMLQLVYREVQKDFPEVTHLTAKVKPGNIASQKVFTDVGFKEKYREYEIEVLKEKELKNSEYSEKTGGYCCSRTIKM